MYPKLQTFFLQDKRNLVICIKFKFSQNIDHDVYKSQWLKS